MMLDWMRDASVWIKSDGSAWIKGRLTGFGGRLVGLRATALLFLVYCLWQSVSLGASVGADGQGGSPELCRIILIDQS